MKTLIFEPYGSGHHREYLENIIRCLPVNGACEVHIVTTPLFKSHFQTIKSTAGKSIRLSYLKDGDVDFIQREKSRLAKGRMQLELMNKYICEIKPVNVLMMDMNFSIISLGKFTFGRDVSLKGILFNAFIPPCRVKNKIRKILIRLTNIRKLLQLKWLLQNKVLSQIYLINDEPVAATLNRIFSAKPVFKSIPDPIPAGSPTNFTRDSELRSNVFSFVLAGSMGPRKSCIEVLDALQQLSNPHNRLIELKITGKFDSKAEAYLRKVIKVAHELQEKRKDIRVTMDNRFLGTGEFSDSIKRSDCVLIPYKGFYASSGMIGHACRYKKPVISCEEGRVGEIVADMGIGVCVNPKKVVEVTRAMSSVLEGELTCNISAAEAYVKKSDPSVFAGEILDRDSI